jgi:ubiquinone/menaquinone biosynthesis C-methylase UbiE
VAGPAEVWAAGDAYEPYVGRWSRLVAREFVAWLGMAGGAVWLDVGCGTRGAQPDGAGGGRPGRGGRRRPSLGFLAHARTRLGGQVWPAAADARRLPLADARVDAAVSGLVLNFVPDPAAAVAEMARVTRPGGRWRPTYGTTPAGWS